MELEICVACIDKSGSSLFTAGAGEGEEESAGHFLTVPRHVAAIIGNLLPEMCLPSVDGNRHEKMMPGIVCWVDCGPGKHDSDRLLP
jgi:hypothetical protein